ncbi:UNVERIFIED_CONTAM: protein PAF1 [Sesamum radiatum]|uniref:Protein PAF1 n=1 Tax=Sesamum radiatum TaxID=300843 RepID=A0AAW2VK89_SESRA
MRSCCTTMILLLQLRLMGKKKDRPTDKGVSWLVKTQYISPLSMDSTKQSLTEKQAKELRESRGRNLLENLNSRERKIKDIATSFEACKSKPVHATNPQLQPKRVLPLLPDFDRYDDQFVVANFDSAPTADSEIYRKLSAAERDEYENRAIMKSYVSSSSDAEKPYKFLAYMVPSVDELEKDMYDENEDISYSWVREYHWDVRGDDVDDPTTYLMTFGETEAKYLPLPTKLILRKKRAREGKSGDEVEHFPVPKRVTVRRRSTAAAVELREEGDYVTPKGSNRARSGRGGMDSNDGRLRRIVQDTDADNYSGAEDDMSE